MIPPLASSLPETGRKRTVRSMSSNFLSSRIATAQGWVSTSWASTWRPPDGRRVQCPATNFHFGFSLPRSSFMLVFSGEVMASRGTSVASIPHARALTASNTRTASALFTSSPSFWDGPRSPDHEACWRARATEEFVTFVSGLAGEGTGAESTLRHGQHDLEEASLAFFAFQLDATAVDFDCPARGREAQPRPSRFSGSSLIDTVEALEDSPVMHRGDAQPCVLDLDRGLPGGRLLHPHANCPFGGGVFDRVVEHVDQTQPEDHGIAPRPDRRRGVEAQALLLFLGEDSQMLHDTCHETVEIHHFECQLDPA